MYVFINPIYMHIDMVPTYQNSCPNDQNLARNIMCNILKNI